MPAQLGLPAALRRFGLTVELVPGWETRSAGSFAPRGAVCHWTAGPRGTTGRPSLNICVNGRSDLPGPLCNVYLDRRGIAVVVSANRANHAGAGGWRGLSANSQVFGTEAESAGDGDWTDAQKWAYPRVNAAYCSLGGFGPEMVCGHNEWAPTRKVDIRDWPMPTMRQQVAAVLGGTTPAPPKEEDIMASMDDLNAALRDPKYIEFLADRIRLHLRDLGPAEYRLSTIAANAAAAKDGVNELLSRLPAEQPPPGA